MFAAPHRDRRIRPAEPPHVTERIHAVVFAGGSAFGLEALRACAAFSNRKASVTTAAAGPLVPAPSLRSRHRQEARAPDARDGRAASGGRAEAKVAEGAVGAGTGATVGKLFGMERAMKSGIGSFTVESAGGLLVSSLAAVNAFGDVIDSRPATGKIVAGARRSPDSTEFANTSPKRNRQRRALPHQNTTLVIVATNARLSKVGATKLAEFASLGVARSIAPVWTTFDGDVVIALSAVRSRPISMRSAWQRRSAFPRRSCERCNWPPAWEAYLDYIRELELATPGRLTSFSMSH